MCALVIRRMERKERPFPHITHYNFESEEKVDTSENAHWGGEMEPTGLVRSVESSKSLRKICKERSLDRIVQSNWRVQLEFLRRGGGSQRTIYFSQNLGGGS